MIIFDANAIQTHFRLEKDLFPQVDRHIHGGCTACQSMLYGVNTEAVRGSGKYCTGVNRRLYTYFRKLQKNSTKQNGETELDENWDYKKTGKK